MKLLFYLSIISFLITLQLSNNYFYTLTNLILMNISKRLPIIYFNTLIFFFLIFFSLNSCSSEVNSPTYVIDESNFNNIPKVYDGYLYQKMHQIQYYIVDEIQPINSIDYYSSIDSEIIAKINYGVNQVSSIIINHINNTNFIVLVNGPSSFELEVDLNIPNPKIFFFKSDHDFATFEFLDDDNNWQITSGPYTTFGEFYSKNLDLADVLVPFISRLVDLEYDKFITDDKIPLFNLSIDCLNSNILLSNSLTCTGDWQTRFATGLYASTCCQNAYNDLHGMCSNQWCIGCCNVNCDYACIPNLGQYLCMCTGHGQACAEGDNGGGGSGGDCPGCVQPQGL